MAGTMQFQDGESYETMMGVWSALVGSPFLDWLAVPPGKHWIDVGCGNGASTELIVQHALPSSIDGLDPSEAQLAFARKRHTAGVARFALGSALDLPFADASFDVAIMALVIFFVPDPAKGVAEMRRVVRPGGTVGAYAWDILGGGFTYDDVQAAMVAAGAPPILPPRPEAANLDVLDRLWANAGLAEVETRAFIVKRDFPSFDSYWDTATTSPGIAPILKGLPSRQADDIREGLKARHGTGARTVSARAHAVRGIVIG